MTRVDALITMASWEDRFLLGTERLIASRCPAHVIMYYFGEPYASWTIQSRRAVRQKCEQAGIGFDELQLDVDDPAKNWGSIAEKTTKCVAHGSAVLVDLSTMPREMIWWTFWLCDLQGAIVHYVYHRPEAYGEWLSRDPQCPRLVYRMSGLANLGRRTALVILAGYDVERCQQLINFFEPSVTRIGLQQNSVDPMNSDQMAQHREGFPDSTSVSFFDTNAYGADHGESAITSAIADVCQTHNVILSSLGPKLSAVALYRMQRGDPALALAYAPSKEFNEDYSRGIGEGLDGYL